MDIITAHRIAAALENQNQSIDRQGVALTLLARSLIRALDYMLPRIPAPPAALARKPNHRRTGKQCRCPICSGDKE